MEIVSLAFGKAGFLAGSSSGGLAVAALNAASAAAHESVGLRGLPATMSPPLSRFMWCYVVVFRLSANRPFGSSTQLATTTLCSLPDDGGSCKASRCTIHRSEEHTSELQ